MARRDCTPAPCAAPSLPQVLDILPGAAIVVAIMLLTGCMSPEQARRAIRWVRAHCAPAHAPLPSAVCVRGCAGVTLLKGLAQRT